MNKLSLSMILPFVATAAFASSPRLQTEENPFDNGIKTEKSADGETCLLIKGGKLCYGGKKKETGFATQVIVGERKLAEIRSTDSNDGERLEQDKKHQQVAKADAEDPEAAAKQIAACVSEKVRGGIIEQDAQELCRAGDVEQATQCYKDSFSSGIVSTANAKELCLTSKSAEKTIACFTSEMRSGKSPSNRPAIESCSAKG